MLKEDLMTLKEYLDNLLEKFHKRNFIQNDPISVPHSFQDSKSIEISAFLTSILSFGKRSIIIDKAFHLMSLMRSKDIYDFTISHSERQLESFRSFIHRTISGEDIIFILKRLKHIYSSGNSLEQLFTSFYKESDPSLENALIRFHDYFFENTSSNFRVRKHIPSPQKQSTCKRINMFLRWMIRTDSHGVDFGIWKEIPPSKLLCPCDIHVITQAKRLNLISQTSPTWKRVLEITDFMKKLCDKDPIKYDFALFSLGVNLIKY